MRFYRYCEEGVDEKKHVIKRALLAERGGFEPPKQITVCRISSAVHSTTLPSFRGLYYIIKMFDFTVQYQNIGQLMILRRLCKAKRPAYAYNKVQGHHYWAFCDSAGQRAQSTQSISFTRYYLLYASK